MPTQRIAVIGAGPKGAALAAKAFCLRKIGYDVQVTLFDPNGPGAHWTGARGYTDGEQRLCTPAERDLGFPYSHSFSRDVAEMMQQCFSWQAFLVAAKRSKGGRYADWVNHGRLPPLHSDFARYLAFAIDRSGSDVVRATVERLEIQDGQWRVVLEGGAAIPAADGSDGFDGYDGVVFTGPGPAKRVVTRFADPRLFDGVDFWSKTKERNAALAGLKGRSVVIIGGGGTAAAVTAWFLRNNHKKVPIVLLNSQAMLFTRTSNFFESSLFDDEATWKALKPSERSTFAARLNRGVVWETITNLLSDAENLRLVPGRADNLSLGAPEDGHDLPPINIVYSNQHGPNDDLPAGMVVDATGFDEWAFSGLLPPEARKQMRSRRARSTLITKVTDHLGLTLADCPPVHVPNLSEMIGPGYQSLMVLGAMADKVLEPYVDILHAEAEAAEAARAAAEDRGPAPGG